MAEGIAADFEGNVYGADFLGDVRKICQRDADKQVNQGLSCLASSGRPVTTRSRECGGYWIAPGKGFDEAQPGNDSQFEALICRCVHGLESADLTTSQN
jgi:hypothetical protein